MKIPAHMAPVWGALQRVDMRRRVAPLSPGAQTKHLPDAPRADVRGGVETFELRLMAKRARRALRLRLPVSKMKPKASEIHGFSMMSR